MQCRQVLILQIDPRDERLGFLEEREQSFPRPPLVAYLGCPSLTYPAISVSVLTLARESKGEKPAGQRKHTNPRRHHETRLDG